MPIFDRYLFADYSGAGEDKTPTDAICVYEADSTGTPSQILPPSGAKNFSRDTVREAIRSRLNDANEHNERVIFGMDFQYGWPSCLRSAACFTSPWRDGLDVLANPLTPLPKLDTPARFCFDFNTAVSQDIFWAANGLYGLPTQPLLFNMLERFRLTELQCVKDPKSAIEIGKDTVGGQTICGLKQIVQMLGWEDVAWWPFDGLDVTSRTYQGKHVAVEIFPKIYPVSDYAATLSTDCRDACRSAEFVHNEDKLNQLPRLLHLSQATAQDQAQILLEGWILGVKY